ncbi:U3 snoRNP protein [Puttea exsequens]|nr:U3 snoRNP protein [Puttea exsequens]
MVPAYTAPQLRSPSGLDPDLLSALRNSSHTFLQPPPILHAAARDTAKRYLDPLATSVSDIQTQRQQNIRRKRKRGEGDGLEKPLQLNQLYLDGLSIEQVWAQARKILDASRRELENSLPEITRLQQKHGVNSKAKQKRAPNGKSVIFRDNSSVDSVDEESYDFGLSNDVVTNDIEDLSEDYESDIDGSQAFEDAYDEDVPDDRSLERDSEEDDQETQPKDIFVPDKLGLNDGFFSIDDFNRQSEFLEQQDARGENDGAASDEEDIDWDADPLAAGASQNAALQQHQEETGESENNDGGTTFGDADLNAPESSDDGDSNTGVELEPEDAANNTNDIKYPDFFEPPPRKASKSIRRRALTKTQPPPNAAHQKPPSEDDVQRTIASVRRDIFEDDLTPDEASDASSSNAKNFRSSHQKRQAELTAEIRRLEAAAVAKRDWTLSGEARAADRPINSLLEEDLDFERAGKPIPVITQAVSEDIEAMIKRRILAREFDEVIRRRPENLATGRTDARRGRFELEDSKPQQSLAEVYEAEHLRTVDPEGYIDKSDAKLKAEHAKIEALWKDVSSKLDALCSWHYRPKPPSANINVVADVPTVSMEDARPAAGGDVGGASMLAPQEVYKAGEGRDKKAEVTTGSGLPVGREEMTRDEKTRRRRREKERIRKAGGVVPAKGGKELGKKAKEKQGVVGDLKKGGVKIIGKKGDLRDVDGNAFRDKGALGRGGGGYKL